MNRYRVWFSDGLSVCVDADTAKRAGEVGRKLAHHYSRHVTRTEYLSNTRDAQFPAAVAKLVTQGGVGSVPSPYTNTTFLKEAISIMRKITLPNGDPAVEYRGMALVEGTESRQFLKFVGHMEKEPGDGGIPLVLRTEEALPLDDVLDSRFQVDTKPASEE